MVKSHLKSGAEIIQKDKICAGWFTQGGRNIVSEKSFCFGKESMISHKLYARDMTNIVIIFLSVVKITVLNHRWEGLSSKLISGVLNTNCAYSQPSG